MAVDWGMYEKFEGINEKYLPDMGEGETMATQIVTAVTKLVYKWYNDGDVYDNTHYLSGWCNDLSSYANWLWKYSLGAELASIKNATSEDDYEWILWELTCACFNEEYLEEMDKKEKVGSVYDCDGPFRFVEWEDEEEEEDW